MAERIPGLKPIWCLYCARCHRETNHECECPVLKVRRIGGLWLAHLASCLPAYRKDGGALPDRCPRCKAVGWLDPPAYRRGEGTSPASAWRHEQARKRKRRRPSR